MTTPNERLYDDAVRRRIYLERYAIEQVKRSLRFLRKLERDLVSKLTIMRSEGRSELTLKQQEALLKSVRALAKDAYAKLTRDLDGNLEALAKAQAEFGNRSLADAAELAGEEGVEVTTRQVSSSSVYAAARARPLNGRFLRDWVSDLEPAARRRLTQALRISFTEGESLTAAIRRVRKAILVNRRGAEALVRTSVTHIASAVDTEIAKANRDVIEAIEWVAVLDTRTTAICASRHGKRYPVDSGPRPPAHVRCRSTVTQILQGLPPPDRPTYREWLRRQPSEVQDEILGKKRAQAFRSGEVDIERFVG